MRIAIALCFLLLSSFVHAEIYKCVLNQNTVFSDAPCAEDAQEIELKVHRPAADAIEQQNKTTARYQQDSRVNEIESLRAKNQALQITIQDLQQQRNTKLEVLKAKTYQYSDTEIATTEHGVFKQMNAVVAEYQAKISQVKAQIRTNESRINQIKQALRSR